MIEKLGFNTPICYDSYQSQNGGGLPHIRAKWLGKLTDSYFYYGDQIAHVGNCGANGINIVAVTKLDSSTGLLVLKAISKIFIITPILMIIGKLVFRCLNDFVIANPSTKEETLAEVQTQLTSETKESITGFGIDFTENFLGDFRDQNGRLWRLMRYGDLSLSGANHCCLQAALNDDREHALNVLDVTHEFATALTSKRDEIINGKAATGS